MNTKIIDSVIATEIRYALAMGANIQELSQMVRIKDDYLPERDAYNYVYVSQNVSNYEIDAMLKEELKRFDKLCLPNIKIVFHPDNKYFEKIEQLKSFKYTARYVMALDLSGSIIQNSNYTCKVIDTEDIENLYEFEFNMYKPKGIKYARLQTERKIDRYLNRDEFELLIYYSENKVVGDGELYYSNKFVKFDDFKVLEECRRRGFGKLLLHFAIARSCMNDAKYLYAITDDDGFVKKLYKKNGFIEVGVLHTFRK